ncbi:DUF2637 domain-containing protein [Nocardiopsis sp. FR4]|uniref:DUF2637 domain-containing protein n=1 Tax=Nocardiopsis sp. FR4 TaxID=2605985 RepID=UPI00135A1FAC|nr:DUF2637 domain-containing protein [Nocardiopsis sp. FR4]
MAPYNNAPESRTRSGRPAAGRGAGAGAPVGGALFVGVIALCALVISYNGIYQLAEYGGHEGSLLAHVFPVTYTLLLIMACWVSYLLRGAHPRERFWVDLVLIPSLVLFAALAMLLSHLGLVERMNQGVANVIVAVAPLAALLVALLLWMSLRAHMRGRGRGREPYARPRPANDPTTVLHTRSAVPPTGTGDRARAPAPEDDREELTTRLLSLGTDGETDREGPRTGTADGPDEDATDTEAFTAVPDGVPEDPERDRNLPEGGAAPEPGTAAEAAASAAALPRRSRTGHNPIRRAVEQAPVVPGAAAPTAAGPEAEPVVAVPDHLADEGFVHEPPYGDPVSDEADAPAVAGVPVAPAGPEEAAAPGPEAAREPLTRTRTGTDAPSAVAPEYRTEPESAEGSEGLREPAADLPDTPLWEPPEDDSEAVNRALADYVPPVWTPPEDTPSPEEEREPDPAPVLDHDAGADVRAALRVGNVPPGAARPSDEPVEHGKPGERIGAGTAPTAVPEEPETDADPLPEPEALPRADAAPDETRGSDPDPTAGPREESDPRRHGPQLEKRPMVLKPPRPPMPDFVSGPPSRRVRSEPLRPDE